MVSLLHLRDVLVDNGRPLIGSICVINSEEIVKIVSFNPCSTFIFHYLNKCYNSYGDQDLRIEMTN